MLQIKSRGNALNTLNSNFYKNKIKCLLILFALGLVFNNHPVWNFTVAFHLHAPTGCLQNQTSSPLSTNIYTTVIITSVSLIATSSVELDNFPACAGDILGVLLQSIGSEGLRLDSLLKSLLLSVFIRVSSFWLPPSVLSATAPLTPKFSRFSLSAFMCVPFKMVILFDSLSRGTLTGTGTDVIGLGIESLHTTFVSETNEFITGPGTVLTTFSVV